MRLIRITTNYSAYLQKFYRDHSGLEEQPYTVQYRTLMDDCFGWADFWTRAFGQLGHEVWEPVGNAEPQQKAWAREQGTRYEESRWLTDITAAQIKHFRPDVLFVNDYFTYTREFLEYVRSESPSIQLIIGWCGAPYRDASVFGAYDVVLSNISSLVEHFRAQGHHSEYLRHAFEPSILEKLPRDSLETVPFSFIGSIFKGEGLHNERERLLKYLAQNSCLQIWSDIQAPPSEEYRRLVDRKNRFVTAQRLKRLWGGSSLIQVLPQFRDYLNESNEPDLSSYIDIEIAKRTKPGLYGLAMYQMLHNSKVTFNNHIDISSHFANNMRLYEATGVGACLLTDCKKNLPNIFEPDVEVVTYGSAKEAAAKARYLLAHDDERRRIAVAGQRRTLRDHTIGLRAQHLNEIIKAALQRGSSR